MAASTKDHADDSTYCNACVCLFALASQGYPGLAKVLGSRQMFPTRSSPNCVRLSGERAGGAEQGRLATPDIPLASLDYLVGDW